MGEFVVEFCTELSGTLCIYIKKNKFSNKFINSILIFYYYLLVKFHLKLASKVPNK